MNSVIITWLGHACFKIEKNGYAVVFDPYSGVQGYSEFKTAANEVLCSHSHGDHNHTEAVRLAETDAKSPFKVTKISTFHDDANGAQRGDNLIHVLETGDGLRIAHFGDIGHTLDADTAKKLDGCDAVMIPVGGYFTVDAATAKDIVDSIKPRVVIPMHYRKGELGFPVIGELDDFLKLCDNVVNYSVNSIEITADMQTQTAVLQYLKP